MAGPLRLRTLRLHRWRRWLAAAWLAVAATHTHAADLIDAWRAAQLHDREFAAAKAARLAAQPRRTQAASLWRPALQFSGTVGAANADSTIEGARFAAPGLGSVSGADFDTSINGGLATRWALQARQPLYSPERDAQQRQLELSVDIAELQWHAAEQALMLRSAEAYFDAALALQTLQVQQRQQQAVQRSLAEARDRFDIGESPVTDTHEAAARAEAVRAEVLVAQTELALRQAALADLTGWGGEQLRSLRPVPAAAPLAPGELEPWLAEARRGNPQLRVLAAQVEVARHEAAKYSAAAAPSVDLVAQLGQDRLSGSGNFGSASNQSNNALIGVQLNVPLYSGGWRSAREDENLRLAEKARADADHQAQQVLLRTRAAWLGLSVGAARVNALDQALQATRSRLDATRIGRQVGERTTLELLHAENDAAAAELALQRARITLLLDRLRLAALAGQLDEPLLRQVNTVLNGSAP